MPDVPREALPSTEGLAVLILDSWSEVFERWLAKSEISGTRAVNGSGPKLGSRPKMIIQETGDQCQNLDAGPKQHNGI